MHVRPGDNTGPAPLLAGHLCGRALHLEGVQEGRTSVVCGTPVAARRDDHRGLGPRFRNGTGIRASGGLSGGPRRHGVGEPAERPALCRGQARRGGAARKRGTLPQAFRPGIGCNSRCRQLDRADSRSERGGHTALRLQPRGMAADEETDAAVEPKKARQVLVDRLSLIPVRWHRRKNGEVFPLEMTASLFEMHGRAVNMVTIRDITERREAEEERRELDVQIARPVINL